MTSVGSPAGQSLTLLRRELSAVSFLMIVEAREREKWKEMGRRKRKGKEKDRGRRILGKRGEERRTEGDMENVWERKGENEKQREGKGQTMEAPREDDEEQGKGRERGGEGTTIRKYKGRRIGDIQ